MSPDEVMRPLEGIRVLDFTALPPGGACTVMLADLGAEVIRVEPPALKGKPSLVVDQVALSRGKRSLTLDMRNPKSSEILLRLAPLIDVVVENAKPKSMEERGFGYSHARAANPRLIWCAMTGFGQSGPYAAYAGHDLSYLAHSGLLAAMTSDRDWHPGISLALQAGALSAVAGIEAAIIQRSRTGSGAFVDISLSESAMWLLTCGINPLSEKPFALPITPDRRLYACADGRYVAVACAEPRTWAALCDGVGLPDLKPHLHKAEHAEATTQTLASMFLTRSASDWVERLAPAGAAVTIMNHANQLLGDPQIIARGSIAKSAGSPVPASPIRISASGESSALGALAPPHSVGDDTTEILASAGFTAETIETLSRDGVI